jgi:hypothetical protein
MDFWIKICFDCFNQAVRPLRRHITTQLAQFIPALDRNNSQSLIKFYRSKRLGFKLPPYNSRRHSPESLILDLSRQLAFAIEVCPLSPPPKHEPPQWREFLQWKYPGSRIFPPSFSFYDLFEDLQRDYEREFENFKKSVVKPQQVSGCQTTKPNPVEKPPEERSEPMLELCEPTMTAPPEPILLFCPRKARHLIADKIPTAEIRGRGWTVTAYNNCRSGASGDCQFSTLNVSLGFSRDLM